jgi:hypothetical protein
MIIPYCNFSFLHNNQLVYSLVARVIEYLVKSNPPPRARPHTYYFTHTPIIVTHTHTHLLLLNIAPCMGTGFRLGFSVQPLMH